MIAFGLEADIIALVPQTYAGWVRLPWPSITMTFGLSLMNASYIAFSSSPTM